MRRHWHVADIGMMRLLQLHGHVFEIPVDAASACAAMVVLTGFEKRLKLATCSCSGKHRSYSLVHNLLHTPAHVRVTAPARTGSCELSGSAQHSTEQSDLETLGTLGTQTRDLAIRTT